MAALRANPERCSVDVGPRYIAAAFGGSYTSICSISSTQAPDHSLRRRRQSSFLPLLCSRRGMVFPGPNGPPNTPLLFSGSLFPPQAALRRKTPLQTGPASLGSGSVFLAQTLVAFFTPQSAPSGRPPQCRPCPRRTAPRGPVGDFACSGEVNSPCAKVLGPGPKCLHGAQRRPACGGFQRGRHETLCVVLPLWHYTSICSMR